MSIKTEMVPFVLTLENEDGETFRLTARVELRSDDAEWFHTNHVIDDNTPQDVLEQIGNIQNEILWSGLIKTSWPKKKL